MLPVPFFMYITICKELNFKKLLNKVACITAVARTNKLEEKIKSSPSCLLQLWRRCAAACWWQAARGRTDQDVKCAAGRRQPAARSSRLRYLAAAVAESWVSRLVNGCRRVEFWLLGPWPGWPARCYVCGLLVQLKNRIYMYTSICIYFLYQNLGYSKEYPGIPLTPPVLVYRKVALDCQNRMCTGTRFWIRVAWVPLQGGEWRWMMTVVAFLMVHQKV